VITIGC